MHTRGRTSVVFHMQRCCREAPLQTLVRHLKFRQLCLFQSTAVLPDDDVRRRCIFQPSDFILQNLSPPRRRGRPKQIWACEVYRMALEIAEGFDMLSDLLRDAAKWRSKVRAFCFLPPG